MIIKKIINKLLRKNTHDSELEYLISKGLKLGKNVYIYSEYAIDSEWPWLISIGDNTMISTNVKILAHDASLTRIGMGTKVGRVDIGENVFIGSGSIVLCNVKIGNNSIIGAGSVVTKDVPDNCVYGGNPARYICSIDELKAKHENGYLCDKYKWNEWINAPEKDKEEMRDLLEGRFGYLV